MPLLAVALAAAAPWPARAGAPPLALELNRLEAREGGACRVWFVLRNGTSEAIDPLRVDLVVFGRDAVIQRRIAVDVGPLPAARTTVRIFDIAAQDCGGIGQILLNDVLACGGTEIAERMACADRIAVSSRAGDVEFHK